jgi:hypothetical protein
MPNKIRSKFVSESDLLNYYTNQYYEALEESSEFFLDLSKHYDLILKVLDKNYKSALKKKGFDYDAWEGAFIENINHLTGLLDKKLADEATQQQRKELRANLLSKLKSK